MGIVRFKWVWGLLGKGIVIERIYGAKSKLRGPAPPRIEISS